MDRIASPEAGRVSRFPVARVDDLPPDLRERVLAVQERTGFVPHVFLALAHRPEELRAFLAYHDAVMEREGGLTQAEREMVVVATSAERRCTYCVVAHGAVLRVRARDPLISDSIATNWRTAPVTPRQAAMLAYAVKLSTTPELVGDADLEALRAHGFDDDDVWDIGAVTAFFAMSNRLALAMDLRPNAEFHLMGRLPRGDRDPAVRGGPPAAGPPVPTPEGHLLEELVSTPRPGDATHDARDTATDPRNDPAALGETAFEHPDGDGGAVPEGSDAAGPGPGAGPAPGTAPGPG